MNTLLLVGNVGKDPEVRFTKSGKAVANVRLATNSFRKDANGETVKDTQWHSVVVWGKAAEYVDKAVKKGDSLAVEGEVQYRTYEGNDGTTRYVTEVLCRRLDKVGGRGGGGDVEEGSPGIDLPW